MASCRADGDGRDPSAGSGSMGDDTGHLGAATPPAISRRTSTASEHAEGAQFCSYLPCQSRLAAPSMPTVLAQARVKPCCIS